jgi:hypothetical protein
MGRSQTKWRKTSACLTPIIKPVSLDELADVLRPYRVKHRLPIIGDGRRSTVEINLRLDGSGSDPCSLAMPEEPVPAAENRASCNSCRQPASPARVPHAAADEI